MEWTKNPPINDSESSEWYWYYDPKNKHPEIIEIWPNRDVKRLDGLWWTTRITIPKLPNKGIVKEEMLGKEEVPKKKKRGRPKGSKNKK